jgi:KDO2-lipid IV(A) lauroyltransferase
VRAVARLPVAWLYALSSFLAWVAERIRYRRHVIDPNLEVTFPDMTPAEIGATRRAFYRGFGDVLVEIIKSARITRDDLVDRVPIQNLALVQDALATGKPVICVAAHVCNWEWMLLSLSAQLGYPLDAAYKPLVTRWADYELRILRSRFGARLVPAQDLLGDILQRRNVPRVIALVADQEPVTSERKRWLPFLNRDTAFYAGTEEIQRATRYAVFFIAMSRTARGRYTIEFEQISAAGETLPVGELTARYARLAERQIRNSPPNWLWSHRRWKLKKPLYGVD